MTRTQSKLPLAPTSAPARGRARDDRRPARHDGATGVGVVFDAAPVPMAMLAGDAEIDRVNPALERLLGRTDGELCGQRIDDVLGLGCGAGDRICAVLGGRVRALALDGDVASAGFGPTSAPLPIRVTLTSLRPGAALATVEDLRPLRVQQQRADEILSQLHHAARLCTTAELSASLAHEMGQPLAAVANYTQAALNQLARTGTCADEVLSSLRSADAEARRAGRIVRSLAGFVRSRRCDVTPADLGEAVAEVHEMICAAAAASGLSVVVHRHAGALPVLADRVQIQQVVLNLVKNAAESAAASSNPGEPIVVRVGCPMVDGPDAAPEAEVSVRDGGQGLPGDAAARVFSPFFTTKPHGMGLGLSICRSIIEAHGGRLWGENNPPPAPGATFRVRLPLHTHQGDKSYDG